MLQRVAPTPMMNPPSSMSVPFQHERGCEGDGCASAADTWPLHDVVRHGVRSRLCVSCILLAHRSYYCCSCFFLIPLSAEWSPYEEGDPFVAPALPIATCSVCREAVAHRACLPKPDVDGAAFVCPACTAAAAGQPFTYAPTLGTTPLGEREERVIVVGTRLALALLQRRAVAARAEAERLSRTAAALRRRAYQAIGVAALSLDPEIMPSWNVNADPPSSPENRQEAGQAAGVNAPMIQQQQQQQSRAMPPPRIPSENRRLEVGEGSGTGVNEPPVRRRPRRSTPDHENRAEVGEGSVNEPLLRRRRRALTHRSIASRENRVEAGEGSGASADTAATPSLSALTIGTGRVTQLAMAATAAARNDSLPLPPPLGMPLFLIPEEAAAAAAEASPPSLPTLHLFPTTAGSSRTSPPTPPTLQLFEDKMPDDEEM